MNSNQATQKEQATITAAQCCSHIHELQLRQKLIVRFKKCVSFWENRLEGRFFHAQRYISILDRLVCSFNLGFSGKTEPNAKDHHTSPTDGLKH